MRRIIKIIAIIDSVIFFIVGIITWLISNLKFGTSIIWAGLIMITIGCLAALGGWDVAPGEYNLKFDQKIPQDNYERTPEKWKEMNKSYDFCLVISASAILPIALGFLINYINKYPN